MLPDIVSHLESLRMLPENWDGYGAAPPTNEVLDSVHGFLQAVSTQSSVPIVSVGPSRDGGVLVIWENDGRELEVEFMPGDSATFVYADDETGEEATGKLPSGTHPNRMFWRLLHWLTDDVSVGSGSVG